MRAGAGALFAAAASSEGNATCVSTRKPSVAVVKQARTFGVPSTVTRQS